jgi:DNA-binding transcriptional LysR family regulator
MNLRQMEVLKAVAETGGITRAAEMLGVSQPAVSRMLRHLQDRLGYELTERRNGRLVPTERATLLLTEIARVFGQAENVRRLASALGTGWSGLLRIGVEPALTEPLLGPALARFAPRHPRLKLIIKQLNARDVLEAIPLDRVHVGITFGDAAPTGTRAHRVGEMRLAVMLPRRHALASRLTLGPRDLAETPLISLSALSPYGRLIERAFVASRTRQNVRVQCPDPALAAGMVAALGIAAITPPARADLPEVVVRAFAPAIPLGPIALVPEPAPLSPPIEDLIGELRAAAASWRDALPAAFHDGARPRAAATAG